MSEPDIAILLPYAELFGPHGAGAISLGVRDVTAHSRFTDRIAIFGRPVEEPFAGLDFRPLEPALRPLLGRNLGLAEQFRRQLDGRRDLLVELYNRPKMFFYLAARARGLPLAIRLGNDPMSMRHGRSKVARARILARASAVYCISEFVRRRFLDGLDGDHRHVHVVYNGIARALERPPEKHKVILYAGRITEAKGVHHLIDALEQVLPGHPDWRAEIIGASRPGLDHRPTEFEAAMKQRCARLGTAITWLGFRRSEDVLEHFRRAAIAVVPSLVPDALTRTAIEGVAHACAVVGYDRGGIPEALAGRGLVIEPSARRLAATLGRLIADDGLRTTLQRRAWEDFPFSLAQTTARMDGIRAAVLEQIGSSRRDA